MGERAFLHQYRTSAKGDVLVRGKAWFRGCRFVRSWQGFGRGCYVVLRCYRVGSEDKADEPIES